MPEDRSNAEQIEYWNERGGPQWVAFQERLDAQISPLGQVALERAAPQPGESVLDVGCGCGHTSLELAERVGPTGTVVGIDVSRPMLERARERQAQRGLPHLAFVAADAQTHTFAPRGVDLIFSRFGVMFFADPGRAFANLHGALRPGGRLCFVCWQELPKNDWARIPLGAAFQHVPRPEPPPPGAPGPFAFADRARVRGILETAGFRDVGFDPHVEAMRIGGANGLEGAVEFLLTIGPLASLLRDAPPEACTRVGHSLRETLTPYVDGDTVRLGGATWIVHARA